MTTGSFFKGLVLGLLFLLSVTFLGLTWQGLSTSLALAQGLGSSFSWGGRGTAAISAHVSNTGYAGPRPAAVVYAIYWCQKGGSAPCAPDFSGDGKSSETLTFQTINLSVPDSGKSHTVSLPEVGSLAQKSCGRFQVDLGLANNGGIVGGQVFTIGDDCVSSPAPSPTTIPSPSLSCPYASTQAQVQRDSNDPWDDSETIVLGQSVRLGGFHNGTGRFAGDSVNTYSPNVADIDFIITDPGGAASVTLTPGYPIVFTPSKSGTYTFVGKTRKDSGNPGAGYYSEGACEDRGTIQVNSSVTPTPSPSPTPVGGLPNPTPTPTPSPTPTVTSNTQPECVSLSGNPVYGGAQLSVSFNGKGRDLDGIIKKMEFNFGDGENQALDVNGGTNQDTLVTTNHTYKQPGIYSATLRVRDNSGQWNEWSATPESCKVRIEVTGQVLGTTTPTQLPKAGASEFLTAGYIVSGFAGMILKKLSKHVVS